jgi:hypothetical protein
VKLLRSFGQFWYDFIIGDDWKVFASVVIALAITAGLLRSGVMSDAVLCLVGAALVIVGFTVSLAIDVRGRRDR